MVAMSLAGKQIPETVIIKVHHLSKPLQVRDNGSTDGHYRVEDKVPHPVKDEAKHRV